MLKNHNEFTRQAIHEGKLEMLSEEFSILRTWWFFAVTVEHYPSELHHHIDVSGKLMAMNTWGSLELHYWKTQRHIRSLKLPFKYPQQIQIHRNFIVVKGRDYDFYNTPSSKIYLYDFQP